MEVLHNPLQHLLEDPNPSVKLPLLWTKVRSFPHQRQEMLLETNLIQRQLQYQIVGVMKKKLSKEQITEHLGFVHGRTSSTSSFMTSNYRCILHPVSNLKLCWCICLIPFLFQET